MPKQALLKNEFIKLRAGLVESNTNAGFPVGILDQNSMYMFVLRLYAMFPQYGQSHSVIYCCKIVLSCNYAQRGCAQPSCSIVLYLVNILIDLYFICLF